MQQSAELLLQALMRDDFLAELVGEIVHSVDHVLFDMPVHPDYFFHVDLNILYAPVRIPQLHKGLVPVAVAIT